MGKILAVCGLDCAQCGAYIATQTNDDQKRAEVAAEWSREYRSDVKPEDIYCDGCLSGDGRLYSHCHVCEFRKCGLDKGLANCAHCDEYVCEKLEKFIQMVPQAGKNLKRERDNLQS